MSPAALNSSHAVTPSKEGPARPPITVKAALRFLVLIGILSMFADMCYEGARGTYGPFMQLLGMSAATLGLVAGLGELLGYSLRFISGYITDRTKRYWLIAYVGYSLNLLVLPLLALAGNWYLAALILVLERVGKAIRIPARDAMVSYTGQALGRGWAFALHEALDQIGAVSGPLIISAAYLLRERAGVGPLPAYRIGFAILLVPALAALLTLTIARAQYPRPQDLEVKRISTSTKGLPVIYWIYFAAGALIAAGYADFPVIAFHFQKTGVIDSRTLPIPIMYSIAMGVDALAALFFGWLYDRLGVFICFIATLVSALFAPFAFATSGFSVALLGVIFWGIGMGCQESIMKAAIGDIVPKEKRASAYGVFSTGFGVAWFLGSAAIGLLYTRSIPALIAFSVGAQVVAAVLYLIVAVGKKRSS
jgi:MFS family permease